MADSRSSKSDTRMPDFLVALQGDPWIEFRWRKALVAKLREQATAAEGGATGASSGGRFAYRLNAKQRIRNAIRAPQAVVKIVRGGGATSRRDLASQLAYLSRDGDLILDEYGLDGTDYFVEGKSDIYSLSHAWARRWEDAEALDGRAARATAKTYHLIVSFPEGTDEGKAHYAADAFADRFLSSGEFGDRWSHVRAWHTDRAHPHMHIVIDRRGESGRMMQINPRRDITPARLRALQVDTAAEHGLLLNDTPRVSRGLKNQGLSSAEWRASERGQRFGRNPHRLAYQRLAAGFAGEIIRHEAQELRTLAQTLGVGASLNPNPQPQRFVEALNEAATTLNQGKDLAPMEQQTLERDGFTVEALRAMDVDDLTETMKAAVEEAQKLAPQIANEQKRTLLEVETGKIRQLYADKVPEFADALSEDVPDRGISQVIETRGFASEAQGVALDESTADSGSDPDGANGELAPSLEIEMPSQTLADADERVMQAYAVRGMSGERALARIKGGLEATPETRFYWHSQEIRERMRAGDLPEAQAGLEVEELHIYAADTYRAASRAIERGLSLDAAEVYAPEDRFVERKRQRQSEDALSVHRDADPDVLGMAVGGSPWLHDEKSADRKEPEEASQRDEALKEDRLSDRRETEEELRERLERQEQQNHEEEAQLAREDGEDHSLDHKPGLRRGR